MNRTHSFFSYLTLPFLLVALLMLVCASTAGAESSLDQIKTQMKERIPALTELKNSGVIGENNGGYLEFRSADSSQQALVDAENADRKIIYSVIAKKTQASPEQVGQNSARKFAEAGPAGHWFQDAAGSWYQK